MDSRGHDIQKFIWAANNTQPPIDITVHEYKGAGLLRLAERAVYHAEHQPEYTVYIAGGICDFTIKDHVTKEITLTYDKQSTLLSHVKYCLDEADRVTHKECPNTKFIICPLIGADTEKYIPNLAAQTPGLQHMFNNAIIELNYYILNINQERSCRSHTYPPLSTPGNIISTTTATT